MEFLQYCLECRKCNESLHNYDSISIYQLNVLYEVFFTTISVYAVSIVHYKDTWPYNSTTAPAVAVPTSVLFAYKCMHLKTFSTWQIWHIVQLNVMYNKDFKRAMGLRLRISHFSNFRVDWLRKNQYCGVPKWNYLGEIQKTSSSVHLMTVILEKDDRFTPIKIVTPNCP